MKKKVLIVAYYYPPEQNGGTERARQFFTRLCDEGFDTYVLTRQMKIKDRKGYKISEKHIFRDKYLWRVIRLYDGLVRKFGVRIEMLQKLSDMRIRRFANRFKADICIASFPRSYAFDIGIAYKKYSGCKLIADFRDGLMFEPFRVLQQGNVKYRKKMKTLECNVVDKADLILTVNPQHSEYLMKEYGVESRVIPNGFDHLQIINCDPINISKYGFAVLYTGGLDESRAGMFAYARPLFEKLFVRQKDVTFVFIGDFSSEERLFFDTFRNVVIIPKQEREKVIATQKIADALLLVSGKNPGGTTGKLFEYLFTQAPIINIGSRNNAARIIEECHAGRTFEPENCAGVEQYLDDIIRKRVDVTRTGIMQYTRQSECQQLAEYIKRMYE